MSAQRVDQGMAEAAARALPRAVTKELRTRYRQLRVMTRTAGLAATYAFIAAKEGEQNDLDGAYRKVGEGIRKRLGEQGLLSGNAVGLSATRVLEVLGGLDMADYTRASADIAAFIGWLARLADAACQDEGQAS